MQQLQQWSRAFQQGGWIQKLVVEKPKILVSWIPGITDTERKQAELLDSDSDAEYDEDNQKDNQLDDGALTSDDDDYAHQGAWTSTKNEAGTAAAEKAAMASTSAAAAVENFDPFSQRDAEFNPFPGSGTSTAFNPFPEVAATASAGPKGAGQVTLGSPSVPLLAPPSNTMSRAVPLLAKPPRALQATADPDPARSGPPQEVVAAAAAALQQAPASAAAEAMHVAVAAQQPAPASVVPAGEEGRALLSAPDEGEQRSHEEA